MKVFPRNLVEIRLKDPEDFLKIRETLTRMGVVTSTDPDVLNQVCHILHKRGRYYIMHYKELQALDGAEVQMTDEDIERRNVIAVLLSKWNLCDLVGEIDVDLTEFNDVRVLSHAEKGDWELTSNYVVGKKRQD